MKRYNKRTKVFTIILGTITGISALAHGIFELLKGRISTGNILNEMGAYTIFPNYFLAGIATSVISLTIIIWTIGFIHKKYGAHFYLILSVLSVITGGGIAYILLIVFNWIAARKINSNLSWYRKLFSKVHIEILSKSWFILIILSYTLLMAGVLTWIFILPPGEAYEISVMHYICWSMLGLGFIFLIITLLAGFASDIKSMARQ
jgi:hypothetical protein